MDQAKSKFNEYYNCAEKTLSKYPHLNDLETKTKVPKVYAVGGVAGILLIMIAFNCAGQFLVNALAFAFATHGSMQAIETRGHQGSTQWLSFWMIFSGINVLEYFSGFLTYWIPFYYVFKLALLIWLASPHYQGATKAYEKVLKPCCIQAQKLGCPVPPASASAPASSSSELKKD